ncbi:MAG: formylglycine-generating enzyme family protein [Cyanobacteria bacterium J06638_20]
MFLGQNLSRRRAMKLLGFCGGGMGIALVVRAIQQSLPTPTPPPAPPAPPLTEADFMRFDFEVVEVDETGGEVRRETQQGQAFRETVGGLVLDMVSIPGGTFTMGAPDDEPLSSRLVSYERPQHEVSVPQFLMSRYLVTQAQFQAVMSHNPSHFAEGGAKRPVENVTWDDAVAFCEALSRLTGREYRLPSEAEWEYACRAGTTTPFYFGPTLTTDLANYNGLPYDKNSPQGISRDHTTDVGSFPANAFGLDDMHGNVYEWCLDHWHRNYEGAPTDGSAWLIDDAYEQGARVIRSGSWGDYPWNCRSAYRGRRSSASPSVFVGFRVVCSFG